MKENFQLVPLCKLSTDFVVLTSRKGSKTQKTDTSHSCELLICAAA